MLYVYICSNLSNKNTLNAPLGSFFSLDRKTNEKDQARHKLNCHISGDCILVKKGGEIRLLSKV